MGDGKGVQQACKEAGIPELVRSRENRWLFPAGSVDELTSTLTDLTNNLGQVLGRRNHN